MRNVPGPGYRRLPDANDRLGLAFSFAGSLGLGLAMVLSRFAYEAGANGLALGTARAVFIVPALYLFCHFTRRSLRLPRGDWLHCAGLGFFTAMGFYGHIGAIEYISVGLAAVLFFTFPPMIGVLHATVAREPPGLVKSLALVVAFGGVALMLGVSFDSADPRGIILALVSGACVGWNTFWTARRVPHVDGVVAVFHMSTVAFVVLVSVTLVSGKALLPEGGVGWTATAALVALQALSLPLFYLGLPRIGSLKAGMIGNVQPVFSIVLAFLILGELMTPAQLAGAALVLGGIWMMQRADAKPGRRGRRHG